MLERFVQVIRIGKGNPLNRPDEGLIHLHRRFILDHFLIYHQQNGRRILYPQVLIEDLVGGKKNHILLQCNINRLFFL